MKAIRLICSVKGHKWRRFRQEGADMRQCLRCGYWSGATLTPPG